MPLVAHTSDNVAPSQCCLVRYFTKAISFVMLAACAPAYKASTTANDNAMAQIARERDALNDTTHVRGQREVLAVPPFALPRSSTTISPLAYALADLITTDLSRSASILLVERSRLYDVLREQELVKDGIIDSSSAPRLGRLLQARQLILGSLDSLPNGEFRIGVRIADVQTQLVKDAIDARAPLERVLDAEKEVVFRLFDALGVTLTAAEREKIAMQRTTSMPSLLAYGRGVHAELLGDVRRAREEYEMALRFDPAFPPPAERVATLQLSADEDDATPRVSRNRSIRSPVSSAVDRLNRPLDLITSVTRPSGGPGDPAFPATLVTVLLRISRP